MNVIPFIIDNKRLKIYSPKSCGQANGYVAVPPTNKYHGLSYFSPEVEALSVHGGVTYSEFVTLKETSGNGFSKVLPEFVGKRNTILAASKIKFLTEKTEVPDDWYILGFDTTHFGDNSCNWNECAVSAETLELAKQLEKG